MHDIEVEERLIVHRCTRISSIVSRGFDVVRSRRFIGLDTAGRRERELIWTPVEVSCLLKEDVVVTSHSVQPLARCLSR